MRAEDKRIGTDKDQAESEQRRRQDRAQEQERHLEQFDDLPTHQQEEHENAKRDRCAAMMRVIGSIFSKHERPLEGLAQASGFSAEELEALTFLEAAVKGRDTRQKTHIVYAEDREDLLEQALAVLYPTLSHGMEQSASALREQHDELVGQVRLLREEIASKEDAQEDIIADRQRIVEEDKADDDKDDDDDDDGGDDAADGDAAEGAPGKSTAWDPDEVADDDDAPAPPKGSTL